MFNGAPISTLCRIRSLDRLPYAGPWSGGLRSRQGKGTERFMDSDFLDASSLPEANRTVPQLLHGMEPVFLR